MSSVPGQDAPSSYRVLLADDDDGARAALAAYLTGLGVAVTEVADGELAAELFGVEAPDLVLVDQLLPRLTIRDLLTRLRRDPSRPSVPVLVMSGRVRSSAEENELQRQLKVEGVFRRPLALRELLARMDALVLLNTGKVRSGALASTSARHRSSTPPPMTMAAPAPVDLPPVDGAPRWGTPRAWPVVPALAGEASMLSLCAVAVHAFEHRLSGALEIEDTMGRRAVVFQDGLIAGASSSRPGESLGAQMVRDGAINEAAAHQVSRAMTGRGVRFGEAALQVLGARASMIVQALERQAWVIITRALSSSMGTFSFRPHRDGVMLSGSGRLDPIEMVARACLELATEENAVDLLATVEHWPISAGEAFAERLVAVDRLRPGSSVPSLCADRPSVNTAIQRARAAGPAGVRELLALILSQALRVGAPPAGAAARRHGVLASWGGAWQDPDVAPGDVFLREMVAEEWVRTGGKAAHEVLGVVADAAGDTVESARAAHVARFGPPALDTATLGPAKRYLEMIRARRDEAVHQLIHAPRS